jgi:hypothetical protein
MEDYVLIYNGENMQFDDEWSNKYSKRRGGRPWQYHVLDKIPK